MTKTGTTNSDLIVKFIKFKDRQMNELKPTLSVR